MKPSDFYRRQLEEWTEKAREAARQGDLAAFEAAERERETYQKLLEGGGLKDG
ncbi:MAG: hypothetical protein Q4D82_01510 [Neisseria sp.]|nr:hypothetical protein [Neisseria sp.]